MTTGSNEPSDSAGITGAALAETSAGDVARGTKRIASPFGGSADAALDRGAVVGRYVVVGKLGAGGMGVVHLAYDPELDRKVALKLLLPGASGSGAGSEGRTRLLREAQALAKLSHPNVVAIHDVGTVGDRVWLAMEFVEGQTLRAWAKEKRRSWRDVLGVMTPAGRGLAAAHAAGLLHRDFKPDNVMVGSDGRVRVMDFGLARTSGAPHEEAEGEAHTVVASSPELLAAGLTQTGAILGTPAYMAPEQLRGREVTAAADQFAYCVTLWELLLGERPFVGTTLVELAASVLKGKRQAPPRGRAVPGWVRRVCERGLEVETGKRFESMAGLLDALGRGRAIARVRKAVVAVAALALLAAGGEGYRRHDEAGRIAACEAEGASIDEDWNDETRTRLREGLLATGISYAETTAEKVMPYFDAQAEAWSTAATESCLDAEVRGVWDAELIDRSRGCLDDRRMELTMRVDELSRADATSFLNAVTVAAGLSKVDACRDPHVLRMRPSAPEESRDEIRDIRMQLARGGALLVSGRYGPALEQARAALTQAEEVGWPPLTAAARVQTGIILGRSGDLDAAAEALVEGYFEAAQVSATEVAANAASNAVFTIGYQNAKVEDGLLWGRLAEVELGRLDADENDLRRANLAGALATVHYSVGAYGEAKTLNERALAILEEALGPDHPAVAGVLVNLANVHEDTGAYTEAKALYERGLSVGEKALGPEHPAVARTVYNLGNLAGDKGEHEVARLQHERALAIREKTLGPDHPEVAESLNALGNVHSEAGDYATAKAMQERALGIWERTLVPSHPNLASALVSLAAVALADGHPVDAIEPAERALRIREATGGPVGLLAESRFVLARALWESDRDRARAISVAQQAAQDYAAAGEGEGDARSEVEAWLVEHRESK